MVIGGDVNDPDYRCVFLYLAIPQSSIRCSPGPAAAVALDPALTSLTHGPPSRKSIPTGTLPVAQYDATLSPPTQKRPTCASCVLGPATLPRALWRY